MKHFYRIWRCVDDTLNELWKPIGKLGAIMATDANEALATFRASVHRHADTDKVQARVVPALLAGLPLRRLVKLQEEASEVIKATSKVQLHGWDSYYDDGLDNRWHLEQEVGDFLGTLDHLFNSGELDSELVMRHRLAKREKLAQLGYGSEHDQQPAELEERP